MNIYRVISNTKLYKLGDPIGQVPILGVPLAVCQQNNCLACGLQLIDVNSKDEITDDQYYIFDENLYFSIDFLRAIIKNTKASNSSLRFCLKDNSFNTRFILPFKKEFNGSYAFGFKFIVKNEEEINDVFIEQEIYDFDVKMPDQLVKGSVYRVPQCSIIASHLISPFHLLMVNLAENLKRTISLQSGWLSKHFKNVKGRLGSRLFYGGIRRLNKIGKNCMIHPSAIIEGSIIGDNVKIGAGSVIRLSQLGDDVSISDNVVIANSVLADKTFVANSNFIEMVMSYEEAFMIHGPYQFTLFGKGSAAFAVINCDFRMDQESIKIPTEYGIIDSRQAFLGLVYGHKSKVAGGNIIAAGRIVPNEQIVNPPDNIILKF